ncbi:MAG: hypothetical protein OEU26_12350 [Candidatus Tectomicrobia bacterium]|nr:hypothetical protein [Candidatus Tectomicrobia bacterium]
MPNPVTWPDGKDFAFTIFDDTDLQTVENAREVYAFLADMGLRTTKSVWPLRGGLRPKIGGMTCEDAAYLQWVLSLQEQGFEVALHNVTYHTSPRPVTVQGIEQFHHLFGHYPFSMANHVGCYEGIYWGNSRLTGLHEALYNVLLRYRKTNVFQGHIENSSLFWGDICKEHIQYVRNFIFGEINTLSICPFMPYHDPKRPYVNYWFASSEGADINSFLSMIAEKNQDRLAAEGGACIMYTHLARGFYAGGQLHSGFKSLMERLSRMNGWFVPVRNLLDYLLEIRGHHDITDPERRRLERRWLKHKIMGTGGTT